MSARHCPDCGRAILRLIENTEPDAGGEYKEISTCPCCDVLVYVIRQLPDEETRT